MGFRTRLGQIISGGQLAELPPRTDDEPARGEVGSGTTGIVGIDDMFGGDREINPDLSGRERYSKFDAMWMGDPIVSSLLGSVELPITGARWSITPASDDPFDLGVAAFVRWQLGMPEAKGERRQPARLRGGLRGLLNQQLLFLTYGSMTAEMVWSDEVEEWDDRQGTVHLVRPLDKLSPRYPHTLEGYQAPPRNAPRYQVLGNVRQDGVKRELPGEKLVHHTYQPKGGRWTGTSLLRPAYSLWKIKVALLIADAIGYDRFASGIPIIYYPPDQAKKAADIGRSMRSHERAYLRFPAPDPENLEGNQDQNDTWSVRILKAADSLGDPVPRLRHYDQQMLGAGLAQFMALGTTETGARAVGDVLSRPYHLSLNAHAEMLAEELSDQLIARLVRWNFGPRVDYPMLTFDRIETIDLNVVGNYLDKLDRANIKIDDLPAVNIMRELIGLPPFADESELAREGEAPQIDPVQ
jgi:hypothetical protein